MAHVFAGGTRQALGVVLSDAAALNAWQVLNAGDLRQAWGLHNVARTAGLESGRPDLLAHAMGEQTYGLLDIGRPKDAVHLVEAAREVASNEVSVGDATSCRSEALASRAFAPTMEADGIEWIGGDAIGTRSRPDGVLDLGRLTVEERDYGFAHRVAHPLWPDLSWPAQDERHVREAVVEVPASSPGRGPQVVTVRRTWW